MRSPAEVCLRAAQIVDGALRARPATVLGLPTGNTPRAAQNGAWKSRNHAPAICAPWTPPPNAGAKRIPRIAFIQSNSGSRGLTAPNG